MVNLKDKSKSEKELIASIDSMQFVIDSLKIQLMDKDSVATSNQIIIDSLKMQSLTYLLAVNNK